MAKNLSSRRGQLTHLILSAYHFRLTNIRRINYGRGLGAAKFLSWVVIIWFVTLLDKNKLEYLKKRLESRQVELRRMVTRTEQDGRTVDEGSAQDIADRAASSYTKEFLFHQSNNDRQLLQMVDGALERLREGEFGECISCGKEINAKRLEAVPWTRHCIECQEKLEQGILEETSR
jgi:DnaK suppressor protein